MFDTSNLHNKIVFLKKGTHVFDSNIEFSTFVYNSALLHDNSFSLFAAVAVFCWVFSCCRSLSGRTCSSCHCVLTGSKLGCRGRLWMINHCRSPSIMPISGIGSSTQADAVWSFWDGLVSCAVRHVIPSTSWLIDYRLMQFASCCLSCLRGSSRRCPALTCLPPFSFFCNPSYDWLVGAPMAQPCPSVKSHMSHLRSDWFALRESCTLKNPDLLMEK